MIRIAICDDELQELERIYSVLTGYMQKYPQYEIAIHSFSAPLELLSYVAEHGGLPTAFLMFMPVEQRWRGSRALENALENTCRTDIVFDRELPVTQKQGGGNKPPLRFELLHLALF